MSPPQTPNMSDTSPWFLTYIKLRFFCKIRRFLRSKTVSKRYGQSSDQFVYSPEHSKEDGGGGGRMVRESSSEGDWIVLQRSVKRLHFGSWEEKEMAAKEIKRLAKEDVKTRKSLAELGVIPSLVSMVDSEVDDRRRLAVQALIELAYGTYTNKALMVEAGILSKLPKDITTANESTRLEFAQLLSSISSLANTQFPFTSSELILPFLVSILDTSSSIETKQSCLGTLYNLSSMLDTTVPLITNGLIHTVLKLSTLKETSEKGLATLGNLVVTLMGRKAMENSPMVPENLIEILTWEEKPKCQELSAYILMILAHQSKVQRQKMVKSGIVSVLLEVALLATPLAQKRAMKLLQLFKDERQTRMGPHSGPQQTARISAMGSPVNQRDVVEGKKLMKKMVRESLNKNMEIITRRANASGGECSKLKALVISSSSKSLPY